MNKEQQEAIDMIAGKSNPSMIGEVQKRNTVKPQQHQSSTEEARAIAMMMQAPEHANAAERARFETLRAIAIGKEEQKDSETYAVDFDGTLCENEYPKIGVAKDDAIEKVINLQKEGHTIILWTCREGDDLQAAVDWCKEQGIIFDKVNQNSDGTDCKKLLADHYIDDKNTDIEDV